MNDINVDVLPDKYNLCVLADLRLNEKSISGG